MTVETYLPRGKRLLLAGGGTAGHVNPLLAVLEALRGRGQVDGISLDPLWVGSERIESQLVPAAGVPFRQLDIRFSYRLPVPRNWSYYWRHILPLLGGRPFRQALRIVDEFQPSLVLASGGYVAAPTIWAALRCGVRVALLQLDDPPGLVNAHFADRAWRILCGSPAIAARFIGHCSPDKLHVIGFPALPPRRTPAEVRAEYGIEPGRRVLIAIGGSLGAGAVHHAVLDFVRLVAAEPDPRWSQLAILHVGGERTELLDREPVMAAQCAAPSDQAGHCPATTGIQYIRTGYLADTPGALAASDFYFGRCGSATVGELIAAGLPALLMPDPQHADHHQYGNARVLVDNGQGEVLEQASAGQGAQMAAWLRRSWDRARLPAPHPPAAEVAARALVLP